MTKTLKQLRQKREAAQTTMKDLAAAAGENVFTAEQRTAFDAAKTEKAALDVQIADLEALHEEDRTTSATSTAIVVGADHAQEKPWATFGEQLLAIKEAGTSRGRIVDPRLHASLGQNEAVEAEGGFAVADQFIPDLLSNIYDTGILTSRCSRTPMASRTLSMPAIDETSRVNGSRWGGIQSYWEGEGKPLQPSEAKLRRLTLTANKLTALIYLTSELQEDAPAVGAYVNRVAPDEIAFTMDASVYAGTGAGQPLGILSSPALVTVPKDTNQATGTITTNNVLQMRGRMPARNRKDAVWLIAQDAEAQLLALTLGSGTAVELLYTPPGFKNNTSPYGMLLGSPVIPIEQASAVGTVGDIVYADMSQYILGMRNGLRVDTSIHVAFLTDEVAFRFIQRLDGQPLWKTPLGQYNGGNALSPFVALAARP